MVLLQRLAGLVRRPQELLGLANPLLHLLASGLECCVKVNSQRHHHPIM